MSEVKRYWMTIGHAQDAGLGGEGWTVRMSDNVPHGTHLKYVLASDYDALAARVQELEADAKRYRWLRDTQAWDSAKREECAAALEIACELAGENWDQVIDAAMLKFAPSQAETREEHG